MQGPQRCDLSGLAKTVSSSLKRASAQVDDSAGYVVSWEHAAKGDQATKPTVAEGDRQRFQASLVKMYLLIPPGAAGGFVTRYVGVVLYPVHFIYLAVTDVIGGSDMTISLMLLSIFVWQEQSSCVVPEAGFRTTSNIQPRRVGGHSMERQSLWSVGSPSKTLARQIARQSA